MMYPQILQMVKEKYKPLWFNQVPEIGMHPEI